jgi:hypothetical protein
VSQQQPAEQGTGLAEVPAWKLISATPSQNFRTMEETKGSASTIAQPDTSASPSWHKVQQRVAINCWSILTLF